MTGLTVRRLLLQFEPGGPPLINVAGAFVIPNGPSLLVAPSGSGKTSLLRLMSGWYEPGERFPCSTRLDVDFDPLRDVDFIGNHQTLLPWYTVRRNIELRGESDPAKVEALWDDVGLAPAALDRFPYELSLGMYKRAELVAALCSSSKLLLLDEFFSSLDPAAREACLALMGRLQGSARAVVVTTHTPESFPTVSSCFEFDTNGQGQIVGIARAS